MGEAEPVGVELDDLLSDRVVKIGHSETRQQ